MSLQIGRYEIIARDTAYSMRIFMRRQVHTVATDEDRPAGARTRHRAGVPDSSRLASRGDQDHGGSDGDPPWATYTSAGTFTVRLH